jgi:hypothetical protein
MGRSPLVAKFSLICALEFHNHTTEKSPNVVRRVFARAQYAMEAPWRIQMFGGLRADHIVTPIRKGSET